VPARVAAAVVAILAAGAALRFWHIGGGIPYNLGQDEPQIMERVVHMMKTGDLNPHFFDWPSLTFYLQLAVAVATFLLGSMQGLWAHLDHVSAANFYLTGRQFTAIVGTATILLTFAAARRWGHGVALLAAALVAVNPNHVRESHYVLTDVPTTFFTTLALWLSLRAWEQRTWGRLLAASAAAGLAASCKYNGAIAVVMPLAVAITGGGGVAGAATRVSGVMGVMLAAFVAGTPYALLDLPKFLNDYARLAAIFARERGGEPGWSLYLKYLSGAMAWPALAAAFAGGLLLLRRMVTGPARAPAVMLVGFSILYFTVLAGSFQIYGRYMLPLYPFLSTMAAIAAFTLADAAGWLLRSTGRARTSWLAVAVSAVVLAAPVARAVDFGGSLGRPSTVEQAYQWLLANAAPGTAVAVEAGALQLPPPYRTVRVRSLLDRTMDDYRQEGVEYLLAASPAFQAALADPQKEREAYVAYRTLLGAALEVAAFDGAPDVSGPTIRVYRLPK
jgi:4-amino-4-deoxy-L-arabinose transferase-like glycosyltransferase